MFPGLLSLQRPIWSTSAANLKFLSVLRRVRYRNFKFKAATQINKLLELLQFRSSPQRLLRYYANFGIGALVPPIWKFLHQRQIRPRNFK